MICPHCHQEIKPNRGTAVVFFVVSTLAVIGWCYAAWGQACSDLPPVFPPDATIQIDFGPISTFSGITSYPQSASEAWFLHPHRRRTNIRKAARCVPAPYPTPTPPPSANGGVPIYTPQTLRGTNIIPINIDVIHGWPEPPGAPYRNFFPPGDALDTLGYLQYDFQEVNRTFLSELGIMFQIRHIHIWNVAIPPTPPPSPTPGWWEPTNTQALMNIWEGWFNSGAVPRRWTLFLEGWQNGGGWNGANPCGGYTLVGIRWEGVPFEKWGHSVHDQNHFYLSHELAHGLGGSHAYCLGLDGCADGAQCGPPPTPFVGRCPADVYHYTVLTSSCGCFGQWAFVLTAPIDAEIESKMLDKAFNHPEQISCIEHASDNTCTGYAPWLAPHCDNCSCRTPLDTASYLRQWDWNGDGIGDSCSQ